ncbi:hypothetical protein AC249_AIPGENE15135, partial [Exaiptasia diaphana]
MVIEPSLLPFHLGPDKSTTVGFQGIQLPVQPLLAGAEITGFTTSASELAKCRAAVTGYGGVGFRQSLKTLAQGTGGGNMVADLIENDASLNLDLGHVDFAVELVEDDDGLT